MGDDKKTLPDNFMRTLREIRQGSVLGELDAKLQQLVGDVRATGKGGKITLTLSVSPMKRAGEHTIIVDDDVKVVAPAFERPGTVLYANDDNGLSRKDPRQPELSGLREAGRIVPMPQPEGAKEAASE